MGVCGKKDIAVTNIGKMRIEIEHVSVVWWAQAAQVPMLYAGVLCVNGSSI